MKSAIIALCLIGCAYATSAPFVNILRNDFEQTPEGNFKYTYEADNGIAGQAEGKLKVFNKDEVALEVTGTNQFKSPEGEVFEVSYIANENGYQPQGAHLPTTPAPIPIPDYIARAIDYIAAHPYQEKKL